ncbi:MAG: HNH endonuclease [Gammaproteobacteria bacterium]|nr:HNH endonuclease [Gammaproteobacteria bacterium]
MSPLILRLEINGQPLRWIPWQEAIVLHTRDRIAWCAGEQSFTFWGGRSRETGERSCVNINSIIAVRGSARGHMHAGTPPLSNRELFLRDGHICMYCGQQFFEYELTRDHIVPLSKGGRDSWNNVATACRPCNHKKGARTPEEADMPLVAVPYAPNRAEYLALSNRRILADQMEFLSKRFKRKERIVEGR